MTREERDDIVAKVYILLRAWVVGNGALTSKGEAQLAVYLRDIFIDLEETRR